MFASTERTRAYEFLQLDRDFIGAFSGDPDMPALDRIGDLLGAATLQFGLCELYDRQAQRLSAVRDGSARSREQLRDNYQRRGLEILKLASDRANDLSAEFAAQSRRPAASVVRSNLSGFSEETMRCIADSELKPADVDKISGLVREAVDVIVARKDFAAHLNSKIAELDKSRNRPDRGNVDNIPMWKVAVIAGYLALAVWYVYKCLILEKCTKWEKAALYLAAVVLGIVLKFC